MKNIKPKSQMDSLSLEVLDKMPAGRPLKLEALTVKDMYGKDRRAVLWMWTEEHEVRRAHFCIDTGEYLGEAV